MTIKNEVKTALRISESNIAFDGEVEGLIAACKADLNQSGLYSIDETDILVKRAIILYCKANFGYDNPEADRFRKSYNMLKNHLSMSTDYSCYAVTFDLPEQTAVKFDGEIKETDTSGKVVFYSRKQNQVKYKIGDGDVQYIDINGDITISG